MSGTEMQQILAMLQKMGEKQEKLAAQVSVNSSASPCYISRIALAVFVNANVRADIKVDALAAAQVNSTHSNNSSRPVSALTSSRPSSVPAHYALAGNGINSSAPPSPVVNGMDTIPCGPAANHLSPVLGPVSPASPSSPRSGGVEALRLGRQSSISSIPAFGSSFGTSPNGRETPYGNLSLAAATHGAGAPGSLTPPGKEKEGKKEGLYPSRVVLTSESMGILGKTELMSSLSWSSWNQPHPRQMGCRS